MRRLRRSFYAPVKGRRAGKGGEQYPGIIYAREFSYRYCYIIIIVSSSLLSCTAGFIVIRSSFFHQFYFIFFYHFFVILVFCLILYFTCVCVCRYTPNSYSYYTFAKTAPARVLVQLNNNNII